VARAGLKAFEEEIERREEQENVKRQQAAEKDEEMRAHRQKLLEKITDINVSSSEFHSLSLTGSVKILQISKKMLSKFPESFLAKMFSGQFKIIVNEKGQVCLDRDYETFEVVYDYMRCPFKTQIIVRDEEFGNRVKNEFDYLCVENKAEIITEQKLDSDI
jgi:hypothetical protein